jgi:hypothetical protein
MPIRRDRRKGVALLLARGFTVRAAAAQASIGERTPYRWWAEDEDFRRRVHQLRHEMFGRAVGRMTAIGGRAAAVLSKVLKSEHENVRRQAAEFVLNFGKAAVIADLDSGGFAVREKASDELRKLGEVAAPACRKALAGQPSAEVRRGLERLVEEWARQECAPAPEQLRVWRALEVLEMAGTAEVRDVLAALAKGAAGAHATEQAKDALARRPRRP